MKKLYRYTVQLVLALALLLLGGCGDKDELVLITTERKTEENTDASEDMGQKQQEPQESDTALSATEAAPSTEEASEADKAVTLEAVHAVNSGDKLLAGGQGCSVNTIYYSSGTEVYSEYRFLGFGEDGSYLQAYENSKGNAEVLDNYNQCWYVLEDNRICTKIYPEEGVTPRLISSTHNDIVFSLEEAGQLQNVYRENGKLVLETIDRESDEEPESETDTESDNESGLASHIQYVYKYYVSDELFIDEIDCYDSTGEKISHTWVTRDAVYNTPDEILELLSGNAEQRAVSIEYPQGGGVSNQYLVPARYPVMLETMW